LLDPLSATSPKPPEAAVSRPGAGGSADGASSRGGDTPAGVLRAMPSTLERDGLLASHGSPWSGTGSRLLAGGHTHVQWTRRIGDAFYVNPGSVGLPVYGWNDRRDGESVEFPRCAS
jgi:hypothetical protein